MEIGTFISSPCFFVLDARSVVDTKLTLPVTAGFYEQPYKTTNQFAFRLQPISREATERCGHADKNTESVLARCFISSHNLSPKSPSPGRI